MIFFTSTDLWLSLAAFVTALLSGLVGMAGGVTLLGVMTFFLPASALIPIHGVAQLISNSSRSFILRKNVRKHIFLPFFRGGILGGIVAWLLLRKIQQENWVLLMIIFTLLYSVFRPKKFPEIRLSRTGFGILGIVAAALGCMMGATGPLLAPFFLREDLSRQEIVANKAMCQLVVHLVKVPVFLSLTFPYGNYLSTIFAMTFGVICGTKIGTLLLEKVSFKRFLIVVKVVMILVAIRLCWKLILG